MRGTPILLMRGALGNARLLSVVILFAHIDRETGKFGSYS
jgi:hypothetical protein